MDRIIILKSGTYNSAWFRAGHYYRLPEEFAQDLVDRGVAYYEGEDPPFAPADIEIMNRQAAAEAEGRHEASKRLAIALIQKAERLQRQEEYVAEKRARRAAGKQKDKN